MKKILLFGAALVMAAVSMAQTPTVSASKVTMKYCQTSYGTVPIKTNSFPVNIDGFSFAHEGTYVRKLMNVRGCDSVVTYIIEDRKGRLDGEFSVASGKKVRFSKGNLQYKASNGTAFPNAGCLKHATAVGDKPGIFQFASHQYETAGSTHNNNRQQNPNDQEWQDIFTRGASGYSENPCYFTDYCNDMSGTNYDWGVFNAIENGGKEPGSWRCLKMSEFQYLFGKNSSGSDVSPCRANAAQKWGYGHITVNSTTINGVILLPDTWSLPSTCSFTPQSSNNNYTAAQWEAMEENGAVFIPTTGYYQSSYRQDATESYYYTSDGDFFGFDNYQFYGYTKCAGLYGFVRLVVDVQ